MNLESICNEFEGSYGIRPELEGPSIASVKFRDHALGNAHELVISRFSNKLLYQHPDVAVEVSLKDGWVPALSRIDQMLSGQIKKLLFDLRRRNLVDRMVKHLRLQGFDASEKDGGCVVRIGQDRISFRHNMLTGKFQITGSMGNIDVLVLQEEKFIGKVASELRRKLETAHQTYLVVEAMEEFLRGEEANV